ncbi:hypothetical protein FDECE_10359 [Fusarium decemcellulare]|nr:hypothetical protein FDECE_10359 [Fusarium decemcellulare]
MQSRILDTGISVVYEPENCSPVVDIVLVHGLKGHPYKTWTSVPKPPDTPATARSQASDHIKERKPHVFRRVVSRFSWRAAEPAASESNGEPEPNSHQLFWPADFLASECPNARILTYGYDSKITKYMKEPINKNSILSHSRDLLFSLCRERTMRCPLIFIAHSLGGIIVKEMLARSSSSTETKLSDIVESTAAVIFLGTPHRGSPDLAALGEWVRSVVGTLRMETTSAILDALGLKTTDLERAQEAFSEIWTKYDFRVKTFQEGLGLTGINLGVLGNKVVPNYSSSIGDYREHAETLQANHLDMCRLSGPSDPNYRKLSGEVHSIYSSIVQLRTLQATQSGPQRGRGSIRSAPSTKAIELNDAEKACIQSLWFPSINSRRQSLGNPAEQTCHWLIEHDAYQDWLTGRNEKKHYGLVWLKGKPGAGKSTLMKDAFRRANLEQEKSDYCTAAFFFSAKGHEFEHSPTGLFRSLLHQLLPQHQGQLRRFTDIWQEKKLEWEREGQVDAPWQETELESFFESMFTQHPAKKTFIFIDALDECDDNRIRTQAYFWRRITKSAHAASVDLNVCLSSRHFPSITVNHCPEIIVENHNGRDIATYVEQRFKLGIAAQEPNWKQLRNGILNKSAGVFLWAVLVVDEVLRYWDDGKDLRYLLKQLDVLPQPLETLFTQLFLSLRPEARQLTVRLFQWAILAIKPLRLYEWHHILAFIRQPTPSSLNEWRMSDNFTGTDDQLERQIRSISKGLVEVKRTTTDEPQDEIMEMMSVFAGAGSLNLEQGETRVVQVIHESVREFFLRSNGFSTLDPSLETHPIGQGHLSIMSTCLDYLDIAELDALVQARSRAEKIDGAQPRQIEAASCSSPSLSSANVARSLRSVDLRTGRPLPIRSLSLHSGHSSSMKRDDSPAARSLRQNLAHEAWRAQRNVEATSIFETLRASDTKPNIDVVQWVATNESVAGSLSLALSTRNSAASMSIAGRSQVLEDYPALLSYATFELFTHARLAEEDGADPQPIINRIQTNQTWERWATLRENVPKGTALIQYATFEGLDSWVDAIVGNYAPEAEARAEQLRLQLLTLMRKKYQNQLDALTHASFEDTFNLFFEKLMSKYYEGDVALFVQLPFDHVLLEMRVILDEVFDKFRSELLKDTDKTTDATVSSLFRRSSLRLSNSAIDDSPSDEQGPRTSSMPPIQYPPLQRRGSVASFGSASSHTGSLYGGQTTPKVSTPRRRSVTFAEPESPPISHFRHGKRPWRRKRPFNPHQEEEQYHCPFCDRSCRNKDEAKQHQTHIHESPQSVGRYSWSCGALANPGQVFENISSSHLRCGYCGKLFEREYYGSEQIQEERLKHLREDHNFRGCNISTKFYQWYYFQEHLKQSHAATGGEWRQTLERKCMKDCYK